MKKIYRNLAILSTLVSVMLPLEANAESFSQLTANGATVSKMTENQAGLAGWFVTSNGRKYFCKLNVGLAIADAKTLVSFTSSGRMVKVDRVTYENHVGGPDKSMPTLSDLKNGRLRPSDVGQCTSTGK
ncbi:hypothetical protein BJF92_06395 [Rhizobium rhizosphaerae]|uniref:Uncharacterized protein n=2 Tax=Xaviernesmea rhizosphaerae TaxID=1672749 RepID=A0A1Q9APA5_9HYPH|nr:hypothetical protein BJF92_06395 [Xaviernesmea rhizosphaerae]